MRFAKALVLPAQAPPQWRGLSLTLLAPRRSAERPAWLSQWTWLGVELVRTDDGRASGRTPKHNRIILPDGRTRRAWALFMWAAGLWNLITWFYSASFRFRGSPTAGAFSLLRPAAGAGFYYAMDLLADLVHVADIPLNLRLAYVNDQGILIKDATRISRRYRSGRALRCSLLALLPLDWVCLMLAIGHGWDAPLAYLAALARVLRLLRAADLSSLSYELYQFAAGSSKPNFSLQRIMALVWSFFVCTHVVACVAGFVDFASPNAMTFSHHLYAPGRCFAASDVTHTPVATGDFGWTLYWRAIYFSMANLTGLGRDIKPESIEEHVLTLLVWFLGVFFVAFIVGSIGQLSSNLDASEVKFRKTLYSVKRYMTHQRLSPELQSRADRYFEYLWAKTQGVEIQGCIGDLNNSLRTDVMSHICRDAVNSVPLFKDRGTEFISSIVQVLSFQSFPQGEWLMRKHTIGSAMYFILKGNVDIIVSEDLMFVTATLGVGDFVGEGALLKAQGKCGASVRARTSIDTMVLTKAGFSIVLRRFPDIQESMLQKCNERNKENNAANKALDRRLDQMAQPPAAVAELADLSPGASCAVKLLARGRASHASDGAADGSPARQSEASPRDGLRLRKRRTSINSVSADSSGVPLSRSNTASSLSRSDTGQLPQPSQSNLFALLARRPSLQADNAATPALSSAIKRVRGANNAIKAVRGATAAGQRRRSSVAMPNLLRVVVPSSPAPVAPRCGPGQW